MKIRVLRNVALWPDNWPLQLARVDGLTCAALPPAADFVFHVLDAWTPSCGPAELIITHACDGTHSPDSRHYHAEAWDIRSHTCAENQREKFRAEMQAELNRVAGRPLFRVLLEDPGLPNEHFHAQVKQGEVFSWPGQSVAPVPPPSQPS